MLYDPTIADILFNGPEARERRERLIGEYGRDEAERLIEATKTFVQQHQELWDLCRRRRLGTRPDVVLPLVEFVRRRG